MGFALLKCSVFLFSGWQKNASGLKLEDGRSPPDIQGGRIVYQI